MLSKVWFSLNEPITMKRNLMDLSNFEIYRIDLTRPLLVIKGSKGILACAYLNVQTANKIEEACALVTGVSTYDDMLEATVFAVSEKAEGLGVKVGMLGREVLVLLR